MKIDRKKIYTKCGGKCGYCGKDIEFKEMQVDHMHPKCYTKHTIPVNHPDNLMPSCRQCNHYKRADTVEGFRVTMANLHKRVAKIYIFKVAQNFGMTDIKPFDRRFYFEKIKSEF